MSRIQAWREAKQLKQRRRRLVLFVGLILLGLGLFHLCSDPEVQPPMPEIKAPAEALNVGKTVLKNVATKPGVARPDWKHRGEAAEKLLAAVSQAIASAPVRCRLQRSARWEFSLDTLSGRVFDFRFQDLESGQNLAEGMSSCLEGQWRSFRYQGPERYRGEAIRLSFVFKAVDGHP